MSQDRRLFQRGISSRARAPCSKLAQRDPLAPSRTSRLNPRSSQLGSSAQVLDVALPRAGARRGRAASGNSLHRGRSLAQVAKPHFGVGGLGELQPALVASSKAAALISAWSSCAATAAGRCWRLRRRRQCGDHEYWCDGSSSPCADYNGTLAIGTIHACQRSVELVSQQPRQRG